MSKIDIEDYWFLLWAITGPHAIYISVKGQGLEWWGILGSYGFLVSYLLGEYLIGFGIIELIFFLRGKKKCSSSNKELQK